MDERAAGPRERTAGPSEDARPSGPPGPPASSRQAPWRAGLDAVVGANFRVYDRRSEPFGEVFFVDRPVGGFDAAFEAVRTAVRDRDATLRLRHLREGGEDQLIIHPLPSVRGRSPRLNLFLLVATIATTVAAGALLWDGYTHIDGSGGGWQVFAPENLAMGFVTFSLPLILILGVHELAHYVTARRHGLDASLPFFIPVPPLPGLIPIGTFGAFISLREPLPDRRTLFDVGVSGPLAGFAVAIPVLLVGSMLTGAGGVLVPEPPTLQVDLGYEELEGFTLSKSSADGVTMVLSNQTEGAPALPGNYTLRIGLAGVGTKTDLETLVTIEDGGTRAKTDRKVVRIGPSDATVPTYRFEVPPGAGRVEVKVQTRDPFLALGSPLLMQGLAFLMPPLDERIVEHPTQFAGWVGLLVTGVNLIPSGQLDGAHVSRAMLGPRHKVMAYVAFGVLAVAGFLYGAWIIMAMLLLAMGLTHPPPLNDRTALDGRRMAIGVVALLVLVLTFVPDPFPTLR